MTIIIHPYRRGSRSVAALKEHLGDELKVLYRPARFPNTPVVYWGVSDIVYGPRPGPTLNPPQITRQFSNKLTFFNALAHTELCPSFTVEIGLVQHWLDSGYPVVERHTLAGSGGEGIRIVEPGGELRDAPLYVKYEKKTHEFRVHVFKNKEGDFYVGHTQRKVARNAEEVQDWRVRNLANGFFFQLHGFDCPAAVSTAAIDTARIFGADFVALDCIYHQPTNKAYVLEGNTAPGLEGSTLDKYIEFFKSRMSP